MYQTLEEEEVSLRRLTLVGSGTVTNVGLTVDTALSGLFTNTGSSSVQTIGTFTLTQNASPSINVSGSNFVTLSTSSNAFITTPFFFTAPNMPFNSSTRIVLGKNNASAGSAGYIQYGIAFSDTDANNSISLGIGSTSTFIVRNNNTASFSGSLTLGTPLAPTSGGTGLNALGAANTVLLSNGTSTLWQSAPGSGNVVRQSGATMSNCLISNSTTPSQFPLTIQMPLLDINSTISFRIGRALDFSGGCGYIQYDYRASISDPLNSLILGIGAGSYLTLRNGAGAILSGNLEITGALTLATVLATSTFYSY